MLCKQMLQEIINRHRHLCDLMENNFPLVASLYIFSLQVDSRVFHWHRFVLTCLLYLKFIFSWSIIPYRISICYLVLINPFFSKVFDFISLPLIQNLFYYLFIILASYSYFPFFLFFTNVETQICTPKNNIYFNIMYKFIQMHTQY